MSNPGMIDDSQARPNLTQNDEASPVEEGPLEPSASGTQNAPQEPKPKKPRGVAKTPPNADRPPGRSLLPLSRVQKIMKADKELPACAKEAVFLISVATEELIKRLGQAGHQQAVKEKRTTVQRRDVVAAVRRADEFVFLEEILASSVATLPAAPAKRKPKTTGAPDTMNIKDAFGQAKANTVADDDEEGGESDNAHDNIVDSGEGAALGQQEEDINDSMDVS